MDPQRSSEVLRKQFYTYFRNTTCRIKLAIHKEHISQLVFSNLLILSCWGCVVELRVMRVIVSQQQRDSPYIAKSYHRTSSCTCSTCFITLCAKQEIQGIHIPTYDNIRHTDSTSTCFENENFELIL